MEKKELTRKKRKIRALGRRLGELGPLMRGSVVLIGTRNKQFYFSLSSHSRVDRPIGL